MSRGLWRTLEFLAESNPPAAVLAEWRHQSANDFAFVQRYLGVTTRLALDYPCVNDPGCRNRHELSELDDGRWLACVPAGLGPCRALSLSRDDLWIHELDAGRLGGDAAWALGLTPAPASASGTSNQHAPKAWRVGTFTETQSPVFLLLCPNQGQLLATLQGVAGSCGEPFIVLSPTAQVRSELAGSFLQRERCAFIALDSCLAPNGAGFQLTNPVRPILDRFAVRAAPAIGGKAEIASRTGQNPTIEPKEAARPASGSHGRLRWENDFDDIWVGGVHYDLRGRNTARFCIQFLVERKAFAKSSARHLENEIDPFVRKHAKLPALPASADGNLRIQRYFNDPDKKYNDLRKELVKAAGRNGCFYLQVK